MAHDKDTRKIQGDIINSIRTIVKSELSRNNTTKSLIGVVIEDPKNYKAKVKINDDIFVATVPEERHHWIQKDDVVILQDLYNDKQKLIITGKTGHTSGEPQLVFSDSRNADNYVSGVDGVFDADGKKLNYATVVTESFGVNSEQNSTSNGSAGGQNNEIITEVVNETIYEFVDSIIWRVRHDYKKNYPTVLLLDTSNNIIIGDVKYVDSNTIDITFDELTSGKVVLS